MRKPFLCLNSELLQDLDVTNDGQRSHLLVSNVNDAEDNKYENNKAQHTTDDTCEDNADPAEQTENQCADSDDNTEDQVENEQNQTLVCVVTCEVCLTCEQGDKYQEAEVGQDAKKLIIRIHNEALHIIIKLYRGATFRYNNMI